MTAVDTYNAFLLLNNKLNSSDNVNIGIGQFVILYNKWAQVWLQQAVRKTKATQKIDEVQFLVRKNVPLAQAGSTTNYVKFKLPDDWYDHIGGYAIVHTATCKDVPLNANQVKNDNERLVLFDDNWRPDFDFEWFPITIGDDHIYAYFRNFFVDKLFIDYYRYPKDIDIEGYIKPDGSPSITVDPDLDDIYINEIIDLAVADVSRIYQNPEKLPADINRITTTT